MKKGKSDPLALKPLFFKEVAKELQREESKEERKEPKLESYKMLQRISETPSGTSES